MFKKTHYFMGVSFAVFIAAHLFNHLAGLAGPSTHIAVMDALRVFYRARAIEVLLLLVVLGQILSGVRLVFVKYQHRHDRWVLLQLLSGAYLALFLVIHVSAIIIGRVVLNLDTNIYFAMAGLNTENYRLFFIPYYSFAVMSFFGHVAAVHQFKMKKTMLGLSPQGQSVLMLLTGVLFAIAIIYAMTNGFTTANFPAEYGVLVGK